MGFLDVLGGRKRLKEASRDQLFALATAVVTLELEHGLKPAGTAAVVFKPLSAAEFVRAENELQELLDVVAQSTGARLRRSTDSYGYEWLVFEDPDFEDLVNAVHIVGEELQSRGFGPQLLAEAVRDELRRHEVHRRHELLEVVVVDDQPLEAELVGAPLDPRVGLLRDRVEQLLELVLGPHELRGGQRLEDHGRGAGRLQPELGLERDPRRRDREELLPVGLLELLPPEESVPETHQAAAFPSSRASSSSRSIRFFRGG